MSKKELTQEILEHIARNNAEYEAMTPMQRRVRIAREIPQLMLMGVFIPANGYGRSTLVDGVMPYSRNFPIGDLQQTLHAGGFQCAGCAKAAIIVARAYVGDQVHITREDDWMSMANVADRVSREVFGLECADIIEGLYEKAAAKTVNDGVFSQHIPEQKLSRVLNNDTDKMEAYSAYSATLPVEQDTRLLAIYQNIVDNDGHLVIGPYRF